MNQFKLLETFIEDSSFIAEDFHSKWKIEEHLIRSDARSSFDQARSLEFGGLTERTMIECSPDSRTIGRLEGTENETDSR